ncbi:MAG TPA: hypothetical protein VEP90_19120 [Methylomirabilota bacterium]|nr:hypothetical protein [Methylomirabilota bacterium]
MLEPDEVFTKECCRHLGKVHIVVTHKIHSEHGDGLHKNPSEARDIAILNLEKRLVRLGLMEENDE